MLNQERNVLKIILSSGWLSLIWGQYRSLNFISRVFDCLQFEVKTKANTHFHKSIKSEVSQSNKVKQHFARKKEVCGFKANGKDNTLEMKKKKPLEMKCVSKVCSHLY